MDRTRLLFYSLPGVLAAVIPSRRGRLQCSVLGCERNDDRQG